MFAMKRKKIDSKLVRSTHLRSLSRKAGAVVLSKKAVPKLNANIKARFAHIVPRVEALMQRDPRTNSTVMLRHVVTFLRLSGQEVY